MRLHVATAAALALVILGAGFHLSAQSQPLRLVSTAWPPFTAAPGQPRFALDLVEAALKRIDVRSTTSIVTATQFTASLLSSTFDGSGAVWRDAQREQALLFSQPYLENRLVLVGRKDSDVSATSLSALKGKRIAIVEGYAYGEIDNAGPTFVRAPSSEESLTELLHGTVDYTLMDDLVVDYIVNTYPKESQARLAIGTHAVLTRQLFFAIRRSHPSAQLIVNGFNAQLRNMITDRTYHRLLHVNWIRADINGDGVLVYIPASDHAGPLPPQHAYSLFTTEPSLQPAQQVLEVNPKFYLGGTIYTDWATVPDPFKTVDTQRPDPSRSTASVFKFTW